MKCMALLCHVPMEELKREINEVQSKQTKVIEDGKNLERFRKHSLYKKKKDELIEMCRKQGVPFKHKKKHELVMSLTKEKVTSYVERTIEEIPNTLNEINKLAVSDLRCILHKNAIPTLGLKDELALRVYLKKQNRPDFISRTEVNFLLDTIKIANEIIQEEQRLVLVGFEDTIEQRKFTSNATKSMLQRFDGQASLNNIFDQIKIFLEHFIDPKIREQEKEEECSTEDELQNHHSINQYEEYFQIGAKVKVYWKKEDVQELGWRGGWYVARVTDFCRDEDQISVQFVSEPDSIYIIEVTSSINENTLKI